MDPIITLEIVIIFLMLLHIEVLDATSMMLSPNSL